jgi:membrane protease YdiL (CAAX protease family)
VVADYILVSLAVLVFTTSWLSPIERFTKGLLNATLMVNLVIIGLISIGLFLKPGPLRFCDVGLNFSDLRNGFLFTFTLWVIIQAIEAALSLLTTGRLTLAADWAKYGAAIIIGEVLGQLFGNALYEEVVYRGVLLPQLQLKFLHLKWLSSKPAWSVVAALVVSLILFALRHIAVRLYEGVSGLDLLISLSFVALLGLLFALIYLRTKNLFLAIGIHALYNYPAPIFGDSNSARLILVLLTCLLMLLWPRFKHWSQTIQGKQLQHSFRPGGI